MSSFTLFGRILMITGIVIVILGAILYFLGRFGINRLPGTLVFNVPGGICVIPILASLVLSILLTLILNIISHYFR
jgi:multisubunit Na+/H+ antiporter MnhG subunit